MPETLVEGWVYKCPHCGGVVIGPPLDDGILAIEQEYAEWTCQNPSCDYTEDYTGQSRPHKEIRLFNKTTEKLFLMKARTLDYHEFIRWTDNIN